MLDAFDRCYRENLFRSSHVYPLVAETLEEMHASGLILGCITNKRESYARELVTRAGIGKALSFVQGGDSPGRRKPDPEPLLRVAADYGLAPDQCVMVGDSSNDRRAAAAAGFEFIFAAYGYASADNPELTDGMAVISDFSQLTGLLCPQQTDK